MSSVSLHTPRQKRRSPSMNTVSARGGDSASSGVRRGSIHSASDILDRPEDSRPPSGALHFGHNNVPGVSGIKNHGNTCFMNAILQCLSHTDLLAEYFVTDHYKNDVRRNNKINSKKFGTKGELTEALGILLKSLWSRQYTAEVSSEFKAVVGKYGSQYRGYSQHDAQEFLLWILDKIHEDLNIATKKKYRANKSSHGRADEAVAAEALANHMRCNNSFVYDLFQALYRSSLTCPNCHRQSNTFDPFLSVSLPIPQKLTRPVFVTVVYLDAKPKQVKMGLLMDQSSTVKELRQMLASDTKIPEKQIILTEVYADGFHRTFSDLQPISDMHEADNIYAIETPQPVVESGPHQSYLTSRYLLILLLNKQGSGSQGKRFGSPLVLQVPRDITFLELQNDLLHNMGDSVRDGVTAQKVEVLFKLRVVDGLPGKCYLPSDVDHPLYMPTVDRALQIHSNDYGPLHLKLVAEWDAQTKQCMINNSDDAVEELSSVRQVKEVHQKPVIGSLDQCFDLYTQEEMLGVDDAWLCPNCKKRQVGTIKKLSLWSLPDILVIHLKRFKQIGSRRTKLNTLISFPVSGLDMGRHLTQRNSQNAHSATQSQWSPWRRHRRHNPSADDFIYDLYGVCNHYGNMAGGHYTAFCKNPADNQWYSFDDQRVTMVEPDQVVTRAAYLLFYQRRTIAHSTTSSHQAGLTDHWIYHVHNFTYQPKAHSQSHEDLLDDADGHLNTSERPSRGVQAYATMRMPRTRSSTSPNIHNTELSTSLSVENVLTALPPGGLIVNLPPERSTSAMCSLSTEAGTAQSPTERSTSAMGSINTGAAAAKTPTSAKIPADHWSSPLPSTPTRAPSTSTHAPSTPTRAPTPPKWETARWEATIIPQKKETTFGTPSSVKKDTTLSNDSVSNMSKSASSASVTSSKKESQQPPTWDYSQSYVVESYV